MPANENVGVVRFSLLHESQQGKPASRAIHYLFGVSERRRRDSYPFRRTYVETVGEILGCAKQEESREAIDSQQTDSRYVCPGY
jgi:hypothetical protein